MTTSRQILIHRVAKRHALEDVEQGTRGLLDDERIRDDLPDFEIDEDDAVHYCTAYAEWMRRYLAAGMTETGVC